MTGMTTTTTYLDQLTQSPRLGARVALPQQQMQRNGAFLTASHTPSQHSIVRRAAPERAVQPLAPTPGATSPHKVTLGLPTRSPYLPHQPHQLISNRLRVRGGTRGGGASDPIKAATTSCTATRSHEELTSRGSSLDLPASRVHT